jgi:hypothetical protein
MHEQNETSERQRTHVVKVIFLKTNDFFIDKVRTDNIQSSLRGWKTSIPERILMTELGVILSDTNNHKFLKIVSLFEFEPKDLNEEKRILQEFIDELKPALNKINDFC